MESGKRDRPGVREVDVERDIPADECAIRIAIHSCRDPACGRCIRICDCRHFVRRRHVRLEVIRLARKLRAHDAAGEHCRVDVYVVVFGILHQTSQEIEGAIRRADFNFA